MSVFEFDNVYYKLMGYFNNWLLEKILFFFNVLTDCQNFCNTKRHCAVAVVARVGRQERRVVIIILPSVLGSHEYSGHFNKIDSSNVYIRS